MKKYIITEEEKQIVLGFLGTQPINQAGQAFSIMAGLPEDTKTEKTEANGEQKS